VTIALGRSDRQTLADLRVLIDVSIGFILFELGQRLDLHWLRRNPALLASSELEAAFAFAAVLGVLTLLEISPWLPSVLPRLRWQLRRLW